MELTEGKPERVLDYFVVVGLDPEVVEKLSQELHGRPMSDLGKMQVSSVIGEILDRWGRHPKTNGREKR